MSIIWRHFEARTVFRLFVVCLVVVLVNSCGGGSNGSGNDNNSGNDSNSIIDFSMAYRIVRINY